MKKFLKVISLVLVFGLILAAPAYAQSENTSKESIYFSAYGAWLYRISTTKFDVCFTVDSNVTTMDEIGVSVIKIYRSSDLQNWALMTTYYKSATNGMIETNTSSHAGTVTYRSASPGYYYRAYVTFYAKNGSGTGERYVYTDPIKM